jgi:MFS family permease
MTPEGPTSDARRYVIGAATFINLIVMYGVWYSYSVLLVALLREFGWSRSVVSGAFSTFVLTHGLLAPAVGWMLDRFGPRRLVMIGSAVMAVGLLLMAQTTTWWHLYLSFGLLTAVGISLAAWLPSVTLARGWFPRTVGTAVGVISGGIGVGIFGLVPLVQFLIDGWGWRWAYRILAALVVGWAFPAALLLLRDPPESGPPPAVRRTAAMTLDRQPAWTLALAARDWRFWGLAGVYYTGNFVTQMLLIHQVAYLVDHGVAPMTAAIVGGIAGAVSVGGKIGWGALSDRVSRELAYALAFLCVLASIGMLVLAGRSPASSLPIWYALLIGLGYAAMAPLPPAAISDVFGGPTFSTIFGAAYLLGGMGLASGTWSAGKIFDLTGSYAGALWIGVAMAILSPLLLWLAAPRRATRSRPTGS